MVTTGAGNTPASITAGGERPFGSGESCGVARPIPGGEGKGPQFIPLNSPGLQGKGCPNREDEGIRAELNLGQPGPIISRREAYQSSVPVHPVYLPDNPKELDQRLACLCPVHTNVHLRTVRWLVLICEIRGKKLCAPCALRLATCDLRPAPCYSISRARAMSCRICSASALRLGKVSSSRRRATKSRASDWP